MPAPLLSLPRPAANAESALEDLRERTDVLDRLIKGESLLTIANEKRLSAAEVQSYMTDALEMQTEFMRANAAAYQQLFFLQHQEMYNAARRGAYKIDEKTGELHVADLFLFREMRAELQAMEQIVTKFMASAKPTAQTLNITIVDKDSPLAQRALELVGQYADANLFDRS